MRIASSAVTPWVGGGISRISRPRNVAAERLDPRALVRGDVGGGHEAAGALEPFGDRGADRPAVVRVGTVVGERADRARELGLAHPSPGAGVAVRVVEVGQPEVLVEPSRCARRTTRRAS